MAARLNFCTTTRIKLYWNWCGTMQLFLINQIFSLTYFFKFGFFNNGSRQKDTSPWNYRIAFKGQIVNTRVSKVEGSLFKPNKVCKLLKGFFCRVYNCMTSIHTRHVIVGDISTLLRKLHVKWNYFNCHPSFGYQTMFVRRM